MGQPDPSIPSRRRRHSLDDYYQKTMHAPTEAVLVAAPAAGDRCRPHSRPGSAEIHGAAISRLALALPEYHAPTEAVLVTALAAG